MVSSESMQNINSSSMQFIVERVKEEKKEVRNNFLQRKQPLQKKPVEEPTKVDPKKDKKPKFSLFGKKKKDDK